MKKTPKPFVDLFAEQVDPLLDSVDLSVDIIVSDAVYWILIHRINELDVAAQQPAMHRRFHTALGLA